ncbi:Cytochrome c oxidase subunit 6b-1 [Glycine soja]
MAETADKSQSLAEEYYVNDKQTTVVEKAVEVKEVENPKVAASEEPVAEKTVEETTPVAPAVAQESSDVTPPPAEESTEEQSSGNVEENSGNEDVAEETPEIKLETAPADFRFPTTNQTRHCFTRYIEYHRCVAAKGEGAPECDKFAKYYRSLCPGEWFCRRHSNKPNTFILPTKPAPPTTKQPTHSHQSHLLRSCCRLALHSPREPDPCYMQPAHKGRKSMKEIEGFVIRTR